MYSFCTYCSASKSHEAGEVSAIRRYLSSRITHVYAAASSLGLDFYILSGEYGLIRPECPIPWYDHLLMPEEVSELSELVARQIEEHHVTGLIYFTHSLAKEPAVMPYHDTLVAACDRTSTPFLAVEVDNELFEE